jgi:hypothetical protein
MSLLAASPPLRIQKLSDCQASKLIPPLLPKGPIHFINFLMQFQFSLMGGRRIFLEVLSNHSYWILSNRWETIPRDKDKCFPFKDLPNHP